MNRVNAAAAVGDKTRIISVDSGTGEPENSAGFDSLPVKPQTRYKFIRSIGFGGMKGVLLVRDQDTGRDIAMAIMPDFRERPRADLERFVREARITARLEHPNIVPVHDIGKDSSGSPYFTMKYLRGAPLSVLLKRIRRMDAEAVEAYPLERLLQIYLRICNAIRFAHSQHICHLDLKPDNVNLGSFGEVLVLDWGLACETDRNGVARGAGVGVLKGTPGYMAPELIRRDPDLPPGVTSDIYSMGALLYAMLALESPFAGQPVKAVLARSAQGDLPPPSRVAPEWRKVPPALEAICLKAMAFNPVERYRSVDELRADIKAFQAGFAPEAEHASFLRRTGLFIRRQYTVLLILSLLILVMALVLLAMRYRRLWLAD